MKEQLEVVKKALSNTWINGDVNKVVNSPVWLLAAKNLYYKWENVVIIIFLKEKLVWLHNSGALLKR